MISPLECPGVIIRARWRWSTPNRIIQHHTRLSCSPSVWHHTTTMRVYPGDYVRTHIARRFYQNATMDEVLCLLAHAGSSGRVEKVETPRRASGVALSATTLFPSSRYGCRRLSFCVNRLNLNHFITYYHLIFSLTILPFLPSVHITPHSCPTFNSNLASSSPRSHNLVTRETTPPSQAPRPGARTGLVQVGPRRNTAATV